MATTITLSQVAEEMRINDFTINVRSSGNPRLSQGALNAAYQQLMTIERDRLMPPVLTRCEYLNCSHNDESGGDPICNP